jgi:hypothetical protein
LGRWFTRRCANSLFCICGSVILNSSIAFLIFGRFDVA